MQIDFMPEKYENKKIRQTKNWPFAGAGAGKPE
jgi:hypothetical protein